MQQAIFIVGTGRSGTHFTCRSIRGFTNTFDPLLGKEKGRHLRSIAKAAIHHRSYPKSAIEYYKSVLQSASSEAVFVDQHHPNLFFAHEITKLFHRPVFLYPDRPIHQIVASMMNHDGVLNWYQYAKKNINRKILGDHIPIPNQFLGIFEAEDLANLPLHKLCALRVIGHRNRAKLLIKREIDLRFINYEQLVEDQLAEFTRVFTNDEFTTLGKFHSVEVSQKKSLSKFKETLSDAQVDEITEIEQRFSAQ